MVADIVRVALHTGRAWWLQSLNALLLLSAVALVTLLAGEAYYAFEERQQPGAPDLGAFAPLFDLAWFVFVPTLVASLLAGLVAVIVGSLLHRRALSRYGTRAIAFSALAVAAVAAVAILQS
jgi:hypothetical protein